MSLVWLHRALGAAELEAEVSPDLEVRMREAGTWPLAQRAPLFDLVRRLEHRRPQLRALLLPLLAGARGRPQLRCLIRGLEDSDRAVREAATRALAVTAKAAPARFVHALYAARPDVRRLALESRPAEVGLAFLLPLLDDPKLGPDIERLGPDLIQSPDDLRLLLQAVRRGRLSAVRAKSLLAFKDPAEALEHWIGRLPAPDPVPARAETAESLDARPYEDLLDVLLELYWVDSKAGLLEAVVRRLDAVSGDDGRRRRLAWSLARLSRRRVPAIPVLAAAATVHPGLLLHAEIALELRRAAAQALPERRCSAPLKDFLGRAAKTELGLGPDGNPPDPQDGLALAGLLALSDSPFEEALALRSVEWWIEALWNAPLAARAALRRAGEATTTDRAKRRLIRQLGERAWTALALAPETAPLPLLDLVLELLGRWTPALAVAEEHVTAPAAEALLLRAQALEAKSTFMGTGRPRHRLVGALAALMDLELESRLTESLVGRLEPALPETLLATEILAARWAPLESDPLISRFLALSAEARIQLLPWLDRLPGLRAAPLSAVVAACLKATEPEVVAAAERLVPKGGAAEPSPVKVAGSGARRPLSSTERSGVETASPLGPFLLGLLDTGPRSGLADAVLARLKGRGGTSRGPDVDVTVALLLAFDEPVKASRAAHAFWPASAEAVERALVQRRGRERACSLLTGAVLRRWDYPFAAFEAVAGDEGVRALQRMARELEVPWLGEQVYGALARLAARWRIRKDERFSTEFDRAVARAAVQDLGVFGEPASRILLELHIGRLHRPVLQALELDALAWSDVVPPEVRANLARWLAFKEASTLPPPAVSPPPPEPDPAPRDAKAWAKIACGRSDGVDQALDALLGLGDAGLSALLTAIDAGPVGRPRAVATALWLLADGAEERLAPALGDDHLSDELRFELTLLQLEDGAGVWPRLAELALREPERGWIRPTDVERCLSAGVAPLTFARRLALGPHTAASAASVQILLDNPLDEPSRAILREFLLDHRNRPEGLRVATAVSLLYDGDELGLAVIVAHLVGHEFQPPSAPDERFWDRLLDMDAPTLVEAVLGMGLTQFDLSFALILRLNPASVAKAEASVALLRESRSAKARQHILAGLPPSIDRSSLLRRLAHVFAWGYRESRHLLGATYTIRLLGDESLGHTRLTERSIYVNPLALFRGEEGGEAILRGLIVHELGHHIYHASPEGLEVWDRASKQGCAQLLNLVLDEHLERNLRARDEAYGNDLKTLATYAFQRARREMPVLQLIEQLGPFALTVLTGTRIEVGREEDAVRVELGALLRAMERQGSSFSRFVRALRMGLGNRHGDPKVGEALALFKGVAFRDASIARLWEITVRLREIFGTELGGSGLLDLHETLDGQGEATGTEADAIGDGELQREVQRVLKSDMPTDGATQGGDGGAQSGPPLIVINDDTETAFDEIHQVVPVTATDLARRQAVRQVVGPARQLRRTLSELGLALVPKRGRLRGRALDRPALARSLLRSDPRILVARESQRTTDLFLGVVVDCSGSMTWHQNIEKARLFGTLIAEASRGLRGVESHFFGFTDQVIYDAGTAERCHVTALQANGGNNDAAALYYAAQVALRSRRRARLLVMISDGAPTECTTHALTALVVRLEKKHNICCAQVAVQAIAEHCFTNYIELIDDDLVAAVRRFERVIARLVGVALAGAR